MRMGTFPVLCVYVCIHMWVYIYSLKRTREATCSSKQKFALYAWDLLFSILKIFFFLSYTGVYGRVNISSYTWDTKENMNWVTNLRLHILEVACCF